MVLLHICLFSLEISYLNSCVRHTFFPQNYEQPVCEILPKPESQNAQKF